MSQTRTKNSILNFLVTFIAGVLLPLFGLIKYSLFIGCYGTEVNGIQITMESVIAVINVFEICFSLAFRQLLFKPLAEDNREEVCGIYTRGLKIFRTTGVVFLFVGFVIAICFPFFNTSPFGFIKTVFYFVILMLPYGISYFLMGPNLVLIADQKEYKINIWIQSIAVARMLLMIVAILLKLPIIVIFLIESLQILLANYISRRIALRLYPWLHCKEETKNDALKDNIKYALVQRLEAISTSNVDTLMIGVFLNYTSASVYGAYNYIIDNVSKIINKALETTLNSFGNLFSKENNAYAVFMEFFEFVCFIAELVAICVCLFFNDFLGIWLKDVDVSYSTNLLVVVILSFNIYYLILRESFIIARDANGLFNRASKNAVIFIIVKVVSSLILIKLYGIGGAIISTALTNVLVDLPYNPRLLCNEVFREKTKDFYSKIISRTLLTFVCGCLLLMIKNILFGNFTLSFMNFFISAAVMGTMILILLLFVHYLLFGDFRLFIKRILRNIKRS